jgi:serine protease Do
MKLWNKVRDSVFRPRYLTAAAAAAIVFSLAAYPFCSRANAASPASAAPPLSESSVRPLLDLDQAMEALAARVTPAVVNVSVTSKTGDQAQAPSGPGDSGPGGTQRFGPWFFNAPQMPQQPQIEHGQGSGVIISPDGYIVTNNHVVNGAVDIRVTMTDRRIFPAKLVGSDPLTDLAVIKVDAGKLPSVPFGDSTKLHPGQSVLAFGNPLGFRFTVTRGIVSALNRPNPFGDPRKPGEFIQTDAAINPGNSGGPLVNVRGEVVGINTFLVSGTGGFQGMGFAIPSQIVQPTVESLIKYGKVRHGYIGIGISDVTPDQAKFFHVEDAVGAVVTQVQPDAPGAKAGLKVGDVIRELDGKPVNDAGELQVMVQQRQPGDTVALKVLRDGKPMKISVTLQEFNKSGAEEESASSQTEKPKWGLSLSDLTPDLRQQLNAGDDVHGAVIQQVMPGSPADNAGLRRGQIITEINRHPVYSAADVQKELSSVPKGSDALVLIWFQNGSTFRVLHPPRD